MQRLQIQLLRGLGRHELHRRALHGFGNRFGIIEVVLLSLAIGADIFGRHQPGIVTKRCEFAAQVMCADAGFHADQARRTTFAAARWRRAHRGPRRGTSSCRYRCRSRRSRYWVSETWRAPCLWCPLPASLAGGAGARPDHPISRQRVEITGSCQPGSRPCFLMISAAVGAVRNLTSAVAASDSFVSL